MKHLKLNDTAPDFSALDEKGNVIESKAFIGKKWVLYFYPKDLTPSCTVQACNIRDNYQLLKEKGIEIIGVSMDNEKMHQRFIEKHKLPYPLICDTDRKVIDAFGVWGTKKFMGKVYDGIHRTTFVMDESSKILAIIEKPKTKDHSSEILDVYNSAEKKL